MASDSEISSDCIDGYITKIPEVHVNYLKRMVGNYLIEDKSLSAEIHHIPGQPARLFFTEGHSSDSLKSVRDSNKLLVNNLPESVDAEYLEMYFEHTKCQGGGPVKRVQLYPDKRQAIVEFEETDSAQRVLNKQPIKMLGTTVNVERYQPYIDKGETLKCIEIGGIRTELVQEIADLKLNVTSNSPEIQYKNPDVLNVLKHFGNLKPEPGDFVFNDGTKKTLLQLDGTIPVQIKGLTYNIPICIWLMATHPYNPPIVCVKPTSTMVILPGRYVAPNGKVDLPYLREWRYPYSDLVGLVSKLTQVFGEHPPVYSTISVKQQLSQ